MAIRRFQPVWKARRSINDPEVWFDTSFDGELPIVTNPTRLDLFEGKVTLVFDGLQYLPVTPKPQDPFPHDALRYFLTYQTRINYNVIYPGTLPPLPPPSDAVTFNLTRALGAREEPHAITITKETLEDFLLGNTYDLNLAIVYYLVGCDQPRYFLIEYYKALEVIENVFGGERQAITALKPYGVVPAAFKAVKRYGDDQQHPLNVGRHAPPKGVDLGIIDVRRLLEEPASREVFQESVYGTRQAIDAYFAFLRSHAPTRRPRG